VDPAKHTVKIQPGVLIRELDRETQQYGLAVPAGVVGHTGVTGLTLGGGVGWLCRRHGATVDNVVSAEIVIALTHIATQLQRSRADIQIQVLANSTVLQLSPDSHQDLFWAIRGGGPNFGIVTSLTLQAYPVTRSYRGTVVRRPGVLVS
jgi:FAD/FMN-containing dehydrogenase